MPPACAPVVGFPDSWRSKPVVDTAANELGWQTASVLTASPARWPAGHDVEVPDLSDSAVER